MLYTFFIDAAHEIGTAFKTQYINNIPIFKHRVKWRNTIDIDTELLKELTAQARVNAESPELHSEFYFTSNATDSYSVVFSQAAAIMIPAANYCGETCQIIN